MKNIQQLVNQKISKVVCYQWFFTDGPPSLAQQKGFLYCDPVIFWLSGQKAIHIGSYMMDSFAGFGLAYSIAIRTLSELPSSWKENEERLTSCDNVREVALKEYENSTISSIDFYGEDRIIQSMDICFENNRQLHVFCGDCDMDDNDLLFIRKDDEFLLLFSRESDYKKYGLSHLKCIGTQSDIEL